jgi:plastocyanin
MRRVVIIAAAASMLISLIPDAASAKTLNIQMLDYVFGPDPAKVTMGTDVTWSNNLKQNHNTTDLSALVLWDSGLVNYRQTFTYTFTSAGTYPYFCDLHERFGMFGTISVSDRALPPNGPIGTQFTVTVATVDAPAGFVYDVQKKDPSDGVFKDWMLGVTTGSVVFDSTGAPPGTYAFRSRMRRTSDNGAVKYSPPVSVSVTP